MMCTTSIPKEQYMYFGILTIPTWSHGKQTEANDESHNTDIHSVIDDPALAKVLFCVTDYSIRRKHDSLEVRCTQVLKSTLAQVYDFILNVKLFPRIILKTPAHAQGSEKEEECKNLNSNKETYISWWYVICMT